MASYKQFEDLPVWQAATDLAAEIFRLTGTPAFKYRGDLVNHFRFQAIWKSKTTFQISAV